MTDKDASAGKYYIEIRDSRGIVIGDQNVVHQYFLSERYRPLAEHLISFDDLIAERTHDFVGRKFVDVALMTFMEQHDRGYFVLVGEPGIGKTAWAAHIVQRHKALHHFNVNAMGIVRPDQALENLCAQLIARFQLDHAPYLPFNAGRDGNLLDRLLRQAAERLDGDKLVIVIDALDEAQMPTDMRNSNVLFLPHSLPAGVYVVITRRPQPALMETAPGTALDTFTLGADQSENQADVRAYLSQQAERAEIAARLAGRQIAPERFVEALLSASAGNFMYLAYVLPDIAAGVFDPLDLTGLPRGLQGYYERFWNELESAKDEGMEAWTKLYKPVIGMLAAAQEPVSADWIGRILGLNPEEVADFALARWRKFLHRTDVVGGSRWRLYHASFVDFLVEELDGVRCYHSRIADYYHEFCNGDWSKLMGVDGIYGLRHLAKHLAEAERWKELHELVSEGKERQQQWATAKSNVDASYTSYLDDLELAWAYAERIFDDNGTALGKQIRYALICGSIHSTLNSMPSGLPAALTGQNLTGWSAWAALDAIEQYTDARRRFEALLFLAPQADGELQKEILVQALNAIEHIESEGELTEIHKSDALIRLIPLLPHDLLPRALAIAHTFAMDSTIYEVMSALAKYLPDDLKSSAMEVASKIDDQMLRVFVESLVESELDPDEWFIAWRKAIRAKNSKLAPTPEAATLHLKKILDKYLNSEDRDVLVENLVEAFEALAPIVSDELLPEALDVALAIRYEFFRLPTIEALAPRLSMGHLSKVLDVYDSIWTGSDRARLITIVAPYLGDQLIYRAFTLVENFRDTGGLDHDAHTQAYALAGLMPYLPLDLFPRALEIAKYVDDWEPYAALAPRLTQLPADVILPWVNAALEIKYGQKRERVLNAMLPYLPNDLLRTVLARTACIDDQWQQGSVFSIYRPFSTYFDPIVSVRRSHSFETVSESWRTARSVFHPLNAATPQDIRKSISAIQRYCDDPIERAKAIIHLRSDVRDEEAKRTVMRMALETVPLMEKEDDQEFILICLAKQLPEDLRKEGIRLARDIKDVRRREVAIFKLTAFSNTFSAQLRHFPRRWFNRLLIRLGVLRVMNLEESKLARLQECLELPNPKERIDKLADAIVDVSIEKKQAILPEAWNAIADITDPDDQFKSMLRLFPFLYLNHDIYTDAIQTIRAIFDAEKRMMALAVLLPHVPVSYREEIRAASTSGRTHIRIERAAISAALRDAASLGRINVLRTLRDLAPKVIVIGWPKAPEETIRALLDVARWWP